MQPITYEEYLAHHGILGMKWGKRNGPPYPLNEAQMTPKERAKNEVSEYAAKAYASREKAKIREKELVRKHKFEEKEARRQNRVDERESKRQNRVDEREIAKQNRFDEKEESKQNDANMAEKWEQYKRGRKYVRNFLIGAGVMTLGGLAIYKAVKSGKGDIETVGKATQGIAEKANLVTTLGKKAETGVEWPKQSFDNVVTGYKPNPNGGIYKLERAMVPLKAATKSSASTASRVLKSVTPASNGGGVVGKKWVVKTPDKKTVETGAKNMDRLMKEYQDWVASNKKSYLDRFGAVSSHNTTEDLSKVLMDPKKWAYGR